MRDATAHGLAILYIVWPRPTTTWRDSGEPNFFTAKTSFDLQPSVPRSVTVPVRVVSVPSAWSHAEGPSPQNRLAAAQVAIWASSETPRFGTFQPTIVQPRKSVFAFVPCYCYLLLRSQANTCHRSMRGARSHDLIVNSEMFNSTFSYYRVINQQ